MLERNEEDSCEDKVDLIEYKFKEEGSYEWDYIRLG